MANYRLLYVTLYRKVTRVILELQQVQQQCEDLYINDMAAVHEGKAVVNPEIGVAKNGCTED